MGLGCRNGLVTSWLSAWGDEGGWEKTVKPAVQAAIMTPYRVNLYNKWSPSFAPE